MWRARFPIVGKRNVSNWNIAHLKGDPVSSAHWRIDRADDDGNYFATWYLSKCTWYVMLWNTIVFVCRWGCRHVLAHLFLRKEQRRPVKSLFSSSVICLIEFVVIELPINFDLQHWCSMHQDSTLLPAPRTLPDARATMFCGALRWRRLEDDSDFSIIHINFLSRLSWPMCTSGHVVNLVFFPIRFLFSFYRSPPWNWKIFSSLK